MNKFLVLSIFLLVALTTLGQSKVKVVTKSGLVIRGNLQGVTQGENVTISSGGGDSLVMLWENLASIDFAETEPRVISSANKFYYPFIDSTIFGTMDLRMGFSHGSRNVITAVPGVAATLGKNFGRKRILGLGVRAAYEFRYDLNSDLVPVGAVFRGHFREGGVTPFYDLSAGYSFANQRGFQVEGETVNGGAYINPAIGVIVKRKSHIARYFKLAYNYTSYGEREYSTIWQPGIGGTEVLIRRQYDLQNITLSFGLYFD